MEKSGYNYKTSMFDVNYSKLGLRFLVWKNPECLKHREKMLLDIFFVSIDCALHFTYIELLYIHFMQKIYEKVCF